MVDLTALWLPILLSAVLVFIVSSIIHTVLPWHKGDYAQAPDEDKVMDALRPFAIPPGDYMIPRPSSMQEMRTPAYAEKMKRGPVAIMTVLPSGQTGMGRNLIQWFVYSLVIDVFAGYVAGRALGVGATYLEVFRFVGVTAFACYAIALWQMYIWYRRSLGTTIRSTIDGLLYALLTAGMFGWLWPR